MLSLNDLRIQGVIYNVTKTRNSIYLIDFLKEGGKVTPELAVFIADVLEGNVKAKPKPKNKKISLVVLRQRVQPMQCLMHLKLVCVTSIPRNQTTIVLMKT